MTAPRPRPVWLVVTLICLLLLAACTPTAAPAPLPAAPPSPTAGQPEPTSTSAPAPTVAPAPTAAPTAALQPTQPAQPLTPVILFTGWFANPLAVEVNNQTVAPDCPKSGTFDVIGGNSHPSQEFSQVCQDKLLTLAYDSDPSKPMPERFSDQPGVKVTLADYGKTASAPFYDPMFAFLERNGYTRDKNIRVAGFDSRLAPDQGGFLERTVALIEETYRANGNTPVHLVGTSAGPLYAQYLLTHTSRAWRDQYIHGFTTLSGDFPGQGSTYPLFFTGLNANTFSFPEDAANAASSAAMYQSFPGAYILASDPAYFGDKEVVIRTTKNGKSYTPADVWQLFDDAKLPVAKEIAGYYLGSVKFQPPDYPYVDVYAETGSGFNTEIGLELADLTTGQVRDPRAVAISADGDINQENLTNESVKAWEGMPCYHFEYRVNKLVNHFDLATNPDVLGRLLEHLKQPKSQCPVS